MTTMESSECVKVAVNIRPLITTELLLGCTDCVTVLSGEPQVQIGSHAFTYDHVYGSSGSPSSSVFEECVLPLVEALFHGYNATVLAYGQTGSGKTYTMGTNYTGDGNSEGIIPQVMETIFRKVEFLKDSIEFLIRVSFIEIFKEEVFDLFDPQTNAALKTEGAPSTKSMGPSRVPIQIRETASGGITLAGVTEAEVRSKEEMASYLARGSIARATGSTNMNSQSSRSHAIFTICIEQKKSNNVSANGNINDIGDDILFSKLHLVDLAGSERAKRTGADGVRLKEGIHINRGLLALGNVISALGDEKKRKEGGHVPYRDSKLTRLLQDSLGGNSKTLMIACISPADSNAEETINTLKYANRARNIQNKAVVNRDPMAAEMQKMRSQVEQLQAELMFCRDGGSSFEELQILRQKVALLETRNEDLHQELKEHKVKCECLRQCALDAQVEKDKLILQIESARKGKTWDEIDKNNNQEVDLLNGYVSKIQHIEAELLRVQGLSNSCRKDFMDHLAMDDISCDDKKLDTSDETEEEEEKELEHSTMQEQLDKELQELDKRLQQKEAEMKQFTKADTSVLKQHYEKKLLELEQEKKLLQKEIEDLRFNLSNISSPSDESAQKLKADYLQKLNMLESQVSELKKKQEAQSQLLKQKQKSDEASKHLQEEIQRIKAQKVQLQQKIKQESEQFRSWKASREKEVQQTTHLVSSSTEAPPSPSTDLDLPVALRKDKRSYIAHSISASLKKEGRRNVFEMHKLLALNQRQKMVLQRKTEEASLATKRLKELLDAKKSARDVSAAGNANGPGVQVLIQAIEHELEVTLRVHEVRSEYERQMQERAAMAKEVAKLKEESEMFKQKMMSDCPSTMSPSARNSRMLALENMLNSSSTTLVSMASQLSEAEERERVFSGRGRWNQVRSLAEAKNLMNYIFNLASSTRCQLRDEEVISREKDSNISELKEKIVRLNSITRHLEAQLKEIRRQNLQVSTSQRNSTETSKRVANIITNPTKENIAHLLHDHEDSSSQFPDQNASNVDDMDISDSERSDVFESDADLSEDIQSDFDDENCVASGKKLTKKRYTSGHTRKSSLIEYLHPSESMKPDELKEEVKSIVEKDGFQLCCSCSKLSLCKTKRCECRAAGSICSTVCVCVASKCNNRDGGYFSNDFDEVPYAERTEIGGTHSIIQDAEVLSGEMISHGTKLLQSALSEMKIQDDQQARGRKPLSNIGNNAVDQNASKASRRKKWRKSTIQLIPYGSLPSSMPENNDAPRTREDVPPRFPRATESSANNPPLVDRNAAKADGSIPSNKDVRGAFRSRSPSRTRKASDEKENHRM